MRLWIFLIILLFSLPANAQLKAYEHTFDIDLNQDIPMVWRLQEKYRQEKNRFDWKYDYSWKTTVYNPEFKQQVENFAQIEKRIDNPDEELILKALKNTPKAYYPYLGPMLHKTKGLSGKILNLPGIKETKNKFPQQIASRMENIPNLQFVSPELYIYLSPMLWGENLQSLEFPQLDDNRPQERQKIRINPEFVSKIKQKVSADDFAVGQKNMQSNDGLRHFVADKNTPLSGADVRAFINTLDGLEKFRQQSSIEIRLLSLDALVHYWDEENGINPQISHYKSMVNPCQDIARKIKWGGLQTDFQTIIGQEAFGIDDWAYTCDKVIKAYRLASMPPAYITTLKLLKKGYFYKYRNPDLSADELLQQQNFFEAVIKMYATNEQDVEKIRPYMTQLQNKLTSLGQEFGGTPIVIP